jgi:hypothetical protein
MLADVKQVMIIPLIRQTVDKRTVVFIDKEVNVRLMGWVHGHCTACPPAGAFARDGDGD